jgi:N-methylhydantoinase A/oxoprolinase/acetone carboxylase beta subunit
MAIDPRERLTIDLDTGGTFTDGFVSGAGGAIRSKVDTTPHDLTEGILGCLDDAASQLGLDRPQLLRRAEVVRLSTTVGTNTLINRSGAKVGLLLDGPLHQAVASRLPERLPIAKALIEALPATSGADAEAATVAALRRLLERGARIVVVALADGPDLAAREATVRSFIAAEYPRHYLGAVPILPSHEVTLTPDPFVRVCTAVLDAYLHPVMSRFLYRVEDELRKSGYARPLLVAQSNGGTSRVAKTTAIRTWGSGPAGGVAGAAALARHLGLEGVVSVDVGGTSSDVAVLRGAAWTYAVQPTIDGVPASLPVLELESIGIGGGSIASVASGELAVGPQSAGSQPGPAAFGLGGQEATVTDAACVLGLFDPANFLGGRKRLDGDAARRAVEEKVAAPLGVSPEEAARRVLSLAARVVGREIARGVAERGLSGAASWLFATGGAGGLLATAMAEEAGLAGALAFPLSPVFSAFGLSRLDLLHAYEAPADGGDLAGSLAALSERALRDMRGEGINPATVSLRLEAEVSGANGAVVAVDLGDATAAGAAAERLRAQPGKPRLVRLKAIAPGRRGALETRDPGAGEPRTSRAVAWRAKPESTPVYEWDALGPGAVIAGPAIVESPHTTVPIAPGIAARVGDLGELVLTGAKRGIA